MCFPGELEMSEDKYMPGMSKIADAIHTGGAKAAVQLDHGGVFAHNNTSDQPAFTPSGVGTFSLPGVELKDARPFPGAGTMYPAVKVNMPKYCCTCRKKTGSSGQASAFPK